MTCGLCNQKFNSTEVDITHESWKQDKDRFVLCTCCDLIQVRKSSRLSEIDERKRYELHQNKNDDYKLFLKPFANLIFDRLSGRSTNENRSLNDLQVLDFGSGPCPVLSELLNEKDLHTDSYDLYFQPQTLNKKYDLIIMHEVFEHLREPIEVWRQILNHLNLNGEILIRTKTRPIDFNNWWYARDATHIIFPSVTTWNWLAVNFQMQIEFIESDIVVFRK